MKLIVSFALLFALFQISPAQTVTTEKPGSKEKSGSKKDKKTKNVSVFPAARPDEDPAAVKFRNDGILFVINKEPESAIESFTKAIEIDPRFTDAYNRRGTVHSDQANLQSAIADFTKAIEIDPEYEIAYLNRGSLYLLAKVFDLALADFTRVIEINPREYATYSLRGYVHHLMGSKELAAADFQKAREQKNLPKE